MPQYCDGLLGTTEPFPVLDAIERAQALWRGRPDFLELQDALAITRAVQVARSQEQIRKPRDLPSVYATRSNSGHAGLGGRQSIKPGAHNGVANTPLGYHELQVADHLS